MLLLDMMVELKFPNNILTIVKKSLLGVCGESKPFTRIKVGERICANKVMLKRGLRQGDPAATWEYDIVAMLLTKRIDMKLKGIKVGKMRVKHREFADDMVVFVSKQELKKLGKILRTWEVATGLKFGTEKCKVMPLDNSNTNEWMGLLRTTEGEVGVMAEGDTHAYAGMMQGRSPRKQVEDTWDKVEAKICKKIGELRLKGTTEKFREHIVEGDQWNSEVLCQGITSTRTMHGQIKDDGQEGVAGKGTPTPSHHGRLQSSQSNGRGKAVADTNGNGNGNTSSNGVKG